MDDMEPWIRSWDDWMGARGILRLPRLCSYLQNRDKDGMGCVYAVHRRTIHPAMCVCKERGSLLLNEEVKVICENQKATDRINMFFSSANFMNAAQATVVRAFGLCTGAPAQWHGLLGEPFTIHLSTRTRRLFSPTKARRRTGSSPCASTTRKRARACGHPPDLRHRLSLPHLRLREAGGHERARGHEPLWAKRLRGRSPGDGPHLRRSYQRDRPL